METLTHPLMWIQTAITVAAIAAIGWLIRRWVEDKNREFDKKIKEFNTVMLNNILKLEDRLKLDEGIYMKEDTHKLICRNNELEVKAFFAQEMTRLKDEVFSELRAIKTLIINGGKEKQ